VGFGWAHPRGFDTNTWMVWAPARSAYVSPDGLPEEGTWQPIGDGLRGGTALVVHDPTLGRSRRPQSLEVVQDDRGPVWLLVAVM
jgi:hypothetical protein